MSGAILVGWCWVFAATALVLLPERLHLGAAMTAVIASPWVVVGLAVAHGPGAAVVALLGYAAMFAQPLVTLFRAVPARRPQEDGARGEDARLRTARARVREGRR